MPRKGSSLYKALEVREERLCSLAVSHVVPVVAETFWCFTKSMRGFIQGIRGFAHNLIIGRVRL